MFGVFLLIILSFVFDVVFLCGTFSFIFPLFLIFLFDKKILSIAREGSPNVMDQKYKRFNNKNFFYLSTFTSKEKKCSKEKLKCFWKKTFQQNLNNLLFNQPLLYHVYVIVKNFNKFYLRTNQKKFFCDKDNYWRNIKKQRT